jgi:aldehyde dehydrogenase (NAD+)
MSLPLHTTITLPTGKTIQHPLGLFINNEFVTPANEATLTTINPSTGEPITQVHCASPLDVDIAVTAAVNAMDTWKLEPPVVRVNLLLKLASLIDEHAITIAEIEALDSGKPLHSNAIADVESVAEYLRYCAGWADKLHGTQIPLNSQCMAITKRVPLIVGCIVPWNYPISMASWKFCPALAAGCTIVMKSSEITPLSLLYFADLVKRAGFPPGVFNVLSGFGKDVGSALSQHKKLGKVAFTGSTATGQKVMADAAASNLKSVSLECGGKSPLVVFEDADIDECVKWASFGVMYNTGQNCTANSRIIVNEKIHDEFVEKFIAQIKQDWVMGDVFDEKTTMGPLVSQQQFDRVQSYIEAGVREGATIHQPLKDSTPSNGYFISPTIFTNVKEDMTIVKEEIFGPVVTVSKFTDEEDAVYKANDTIYGLAAMVFTTNFERANRVADKLDAGSVYINSSNNEDVRVPFGGMKMSGIGRELGQEAFNLYTVVKSVYHNYGSKL